MGLALLDDEDEDEGEDETKILILCFFFNFIIHIDNTYTREMQSFRLKSFPSLLGGGVSRYHYSVPF